MIVIVPYNESWPRTFRAVGQNIREALGETALAIHHIGSTSVPGLAAKDIIDIQLSVADLDASLRQPLEAAGFHYRSDVTYDHAPPGMDISAEQLGKRYFQYHTPAVHLRVREEIKRQLAARFPHDTGAYYAIKDPVFDVLMAGVNEWATRTSWRPPESDA